MDPAFLILSCCVASDIKKSMEKLFTHTYSKKPETNQPNKTNLLSKLVE